MENANIELIRGHMDTIILRTLQDNDKYGLEMLNEIRSLSDDLYSLKQPTLYSSLKRLEKQGLIESYPGSETKGANRTYYKLTQEGRDYLIADQKQWEFSRTIIDRLLSDKEYDKNDSPPPFDPSEFRPSTKRERREKPEPTKFLYKYVEVEKEIEKSVCEQNPDSDKSTVVEQTTKAEDNSSQTVDIKDIKTDTQITSDTAQAQYNNESIGEYERYTPLSDIDNQNNGVYNSYDYGYIDNRYQPEYRNVNIDSSVDYTSQFEDIFNSNTIDRSYVINNTPDYNDSQQYIDDDMNMEQIKNALAAKNINLKPYQMKETGSFYRDNYYYSNKVLRDWSLATYIVYAAYILISYFSAKSLGMSLNWTLGLLFGGLVLPIACVSIWKIAPEHRRRTNFQINNALLTSFIMMIAFAVVILIVAFFFVKIDISNPAEYVKALVIPICSLIILPISVVIYGLFYNRKGYRV